MKGDKSQRARVGEGDGVQYLGAILNGLITGAATAVSAGFVTAYVLEWHNVSNREGAHGYGIIAFALIGMVVGLIGGIGIAWLVGADSVRGWFLGQVLALGAVVVVHAAVLGWARWTMDQAPQLDGADLMMEIEVRGRGGTGVAPDGTDGYGVFLHGIERPWWGKGGTARLLGWRKLAAREGEEGAERTAIAAWCEFPLATTQRRLLVIRVGDWPEQSFYPLIAAEPTRADLEWSAWTAARPAAGESVSPEQSVEVRVRVRKSV